MTDRQAGSEWLRLPTTEAFVRERLDRFTASMPAVQALQAKMKNQAGNRLVDWLDHLVLADGDGVQDQLADLGFEPLNSFLDRETRRHPLPHKKGQDFNVKSG